MYTQNLMRPKLVIAILVLALSGAHSGAASVCAAYCMSSAAAGSAAVHHHQMVSQPASISHHVQSHHQGTECAECPPKSRNSLNTKADCASLVQIQALKEGSFSLDAPSGAAQFDIAHTPACTLGLASDGERSLVFDASRTIRCSSSASVPLRI